MAYNYSGFGRNSGPSVPAKHVPSFGQISRAPSPSFPTLAPAPVPVPVPSPSSRVREAVERTRSPPVPFGNSASTTRPYQAFSGRRPEASQRVLSPPSAFDNPRPSGVPYPSVGVRRPIEPPQRLNDGQRTFFRDYDARAHLRPSAVTSFVPSSNFGTNTTAKNARFPELKTTRSPPLLSGDEFSRNSSQSTISRPAVSSSMRNDNAKLVGNYPNSQPQQDQFRDSPHANSCLNERSFMQQVADVRGPKRTRSPPITSFNGVSWESSQFVSDSKRPNTLSTTNSQGPQRSVPSSNNAVAAATKSNISSAPKRTRSPPLPSTGEGLQDNTNFTQSDVEREIQAKAKRLARFKVELSENVEVSPDVVDQRFSTLRREQAVVEKQKSIDGNPIESAKDYPNDNTLPDYEDSAACVIIGLCPDMCPESERGERERKGDLDQYERLDGDRNQTSKCLAVKKYNRTAEREANLIRPMPILQKTVGYLLDLLDQPYDKSFLGLYNFLWDRMRAVRMDLRMQHIFNQEAIAMLEQMIRLHIIAMHELCEYTKGEGFIEGFDAHLNIEQMNKTSVELFQMYDDHRKKGMNIPTEKEFRGYYALLKLDKHPGYKVEPAELSLDLAKMTPEIRQTPEVLFARDVARACRTGNFIAFFRLARKASYLQACLMHAHFAKLRTQALASLHSGLQNNQGLPVTHVGRWLGMEEEDIGSLLEYHGFLIKEFEEPYMVKEGPFLNSDKDYPTKCSKLVLSKRSEKMVEDVSASSQVTSVPAEATKVIQLDKTYKPAIKAIHSAGAKVSVPVVDEEMSDPVAISSPKYSMAMEPIIEASMVDQHCQDDNQAIAASIFPWGLSVAHNSPNYEPGKVMTEEKQNGDALFRISSEKKMFVGPESSPRQHMPRSAVVERSPSSKRYDYSVESSPSELASRTAVPERSPSSKIYDYSVESSPRQLVARMAVPDRSPSSKRYDYSVENSLPQGVGINNFAYEEPQDTQEENENNDVIEDEKVEVIANHLAEEVALAKLKLILRLWRRRTLKLKELREQRQLAANAALSSLSLGPPIRHNNDPSIYDEFDIDLVMRERSERHERSWSRLNVSDVIAGILGRRNSKAKCLCWKMVVCSPKDSSEMDKRVSHLAAEQWLFSKLMPSEKNDDDVVISSPGLSIWKKYVPSQSDTDLTCCFSIVKEMKFDHLNDTVSGASAILFLASESIPWKLQKVQLHNLVMSIPSGSCLPLLILSCSYDKEVLDPCAVIINELGLNEIDKSRVNSFLVKFLIGNQQGGDFDGFFSDEQLREGLQWLASESPLQPVVCYVKTRELILTHLSSALEVLGRLSDYEVSPNHCISAFSDALDQSLGEIVAAAKTNPSNLPCPEIALVMDSGDENFPTLGWSSVARIQPLECALRELKLPAFANDISFLSRGSKMSKEIENQRLQLENCLISYLTKSSEMMGVPMARKEASIMLQRSTRLELHDLSYYIVPKWVMIFRRIFNWRLMILNNGALSSSYVLEQHFVSNTSGDLDNLGLEDRVPSPCSLSHPSLDEMMDVGFINNQSQDEIVEGSCSPLSIQRADSQPQVDHYPPAVASNNFVDNIQDCANTNNSMEYERNSSEKSKLNVANDISCIMSRLNSTTSEIAVSRTLTKEADNLSKLFEQCNLVQNTNEKKLCFYF
ncbi:SAC3 family protein B [Melia azedarach]|uniref:SAC3 family protein B n=1 Tax=Melia azedarach TaxID=155640 RepID=A0ACC1YH26_MELAZ|nr:SAC3 family protein B [Melia azedarach]